MPVELKGRTKQVHEGLTAGRKPKEIADELGITRNAVYQHIGRLRRDGILDEPEPRFSGAGTRGRQRDGKALVAATVLDATEQYIATVKARLDAIEQEESTHNEALEALANERKQIDTVLQRMEGLTT
jgi:predicted ArsR family transcriptional regulator